MFAGFSSFPAQLDRSLAAAAGLAVELVLVAEDMAAFVAAAGTAASIVAAALVLALAAGRLAVGMIEAAANLAAESVEVAAAATNWQIAGLGSAGKLAAGLGSVASVVAGLSVDLVSAADMNS